MNPKKKLATKKARANKPFAGQAGRKPQGGQGYGTSTGSSKTGGFTSATVAPGSKVITVSTTKVGDRDRTDLDEFAEKVAKNRASGVGPGKLIQQTHGPFWTDNKIVMAKYAKGSQNPSGREVQLEANKYGYG